MKFPIIGTLVLAAALSATAQSFYAITDLGPGRAYAINEIGHVVGETELRNGDLHAFLWTPDGLTDLGTLGGRSSRAFGINSNDWIVGEAEDTNGLTVASLWRDGEITGLHSGATAYAINDAGAIAGVVLERATLWAAPDAAPATITTPGAIGIAFEINADGVVAGQAETADPDARVSRAFSYKDGVAAGLAEIGQGLSSSAQAINDAGQVSGFFEISHGRTHAFLYDANCLRDVDTMNNAYSAALGINNRGDVVGVMFGSPNDDDQAFLWNGTDMYNLNDLLDTREAWVLVEARDVNDAGQIVGYGIKDERERAYLLTPLEKENGALPRVDLESPANGAHFHEPATLHFSARVRSASPIRRVAFFSNGEIIGVATNEPYRYTWTRAPAGELDFVARAFDARGQMGVSPRVHVTIDLEPAASPASEPALPPGADAP